MPANTLERLARVRQLTASGEARQRRVASGFSLAELAQAAEVDVSTLWRWETGRRRPRGEPALRYEAILSKLRPSTPGTGPAA